MPCELPTAAPGRKRQTPRRPAATAPDSTGWAITPRDEPGPPGGYGTWTLTMPGGRQLIVKLMAVPVTDCDHQHESHGYQPSGRTYTRRPMRYPF
jgi:hypothetical protein